MSSALVEPGCAPGSATASASRAPKPQGPRWQLLIQRNGEGSRLAVVDRTDGRVIREWEGTRAHAILAAPAMAEIEAIAASPGHQHDAVRRVFLAAAQVDACAAPLIQAADGDVAGLLRRRGLTPTHQRVAVARALARCSDHPTADQLHDRLQRQGDGCSRATVYNSLNALVECDLAREVVVERGRVNYDPVIHPHPHVHNIDTGEVTDLGAEHLPALDRTALPEGTELDSVSLVVRVRAKRRR